MVNIRVTVLANSFRPSTSAVGDAIESTGVTARRFAEVNLGNAFSPQ